MEKKIIEHICLSLDNGWLINPSPKQGLIKGYFQLISAEKKYEHFSMYCFVMNGMLHIYGCVYDELNGDTAWIPLNKSMPEIVRIIKRKVISQKKHLFSIVNRRIHSEQNM
ncbi:TPA: hypothetical protein SI588_003227 [Escherichia coli]|uniref:hypothetical protein n=1 Tax=Escherichia coli TaxID=562 RepID=UPI00028E26CA|nr:hypothetical protein [Escherichia coli]MED6350279.1 hypothetical protein [Escherichia coli O157]HDQ6492536.1 hypothetical protein [Escherichia coli Ou:H16]EEV5796230.1 hypothetical protein [Escherichia coli]EEW2197306.1 hypothetical protein [Escherichia coli]EEW7522374.1 hypothetical protein [Escherichia coli]